MKARYLRSQALEQLRADVEANLEFYRAGDFGTLLQDTSLFFESKPEIDVEQLNTLRAPGEVSTQYEAENCKILFEAITGLTPYEARDERFWAYLTHTFLLDYSRKRWPIPDQKDEAVKHIHTHFFARSMRGVDRDNAASRLWWISYLCSRVDNLELDKSLELLLYRADVRANVIERPSISHNSQIFSTIMHSLHSSYGSDKSLFERAHFRPLMVRMNSVGGYKLLDYMPPTQVASMVDDLVVATKPATPAKAEPK